MQSDSSCDAPNMSRHRHFSDPFSSAEPVA
jgi:hypothetical protein